MENKKLELDREYGYNTVKSFFKDSDHEEKEYGDYLIGRNFLTFKKPFFEENEDLHSFVLTGSTDTQGIYKLIYKDNKDEK